MICKVCGTENNDNAKFCNNCGQRLEPASVMRPQENYAFDDEKTVLIEDVEPIFMDEETMILPDVVPEKFDFKSAPAEPPVRQVYVDNNVAEERNIPRPVYNSQQNREEVIINKPVESQNTTTTAASSNSHTTVFIAGISAIVMGIGAFMFYRTITNIWSLLDGVEEALAVSSILMIIGFISTILFSAVEIKKEVAFYKSANKSILSDMYFWIPTALIVFTLLSYDVIKAAMIGLNITSGWDILSDSGSIYQNYNATKTFLILAFLVGIFAIVCKAANINPNAVKQQVVNTASQAINTGKEQVAKHASAAAAASSANQSNDQYIDQLIKLKSLLDDGIISEQEFELKKKQLLNIE